MLRFREEGVTLSSDYHILMYIIVYEQARTHFTNQVDFAWVYLLVWRKEFGCLIAWEEFRHDIYRDLKRVVIDLFISALVPYTS